MKVLVIIALAGLKNAACTNWKQEWIRDVRLGANSISQIFDHFVEFVLVIHLVDLCDHKDELTGLPCQVFADDGEVTQSPRLVDGIQKKRCVDFIADNSKRGVCIRCGGGETRCVDNVDTLLEPWSGIRNGYGSIEEMERKRFTVFA